MTLVSQVTIQSLLNSLYSRQLFSRRIIVSDALGSIARASVENPGLPLRCFYLWGIHQKGGIDSVDVAAITHLSRVVDHVSNHLNCKVALDVIVCDMHAELNGISNGSADKYGRQVADHIVSNYSWSIKKMSDVWSRHDINLAIIRDNAISLSSSIWEELSCRALLETSASKYYLGAEPQLGARMYYVCRMLEKKAIAEDYKNYIHITAADKRLSMLQPDLPELNIWSIKRGTSVKPWFVSSGETISCVV